MKNISEFKSKISFLFTDIDDTLTEHGRLGPQAYQALWDLSNVGIHVIPVTGRPAGWCEMIARVWPVTAVIGENGGFYFRYAKQKMHRHFHFDEKTQSENRKKLEIIKTEVLSSVPGCAVASDQFCRLMDLAIDFCEDVPKLKEQDVAKIVQIFEKHQAVAKVSSIHVNGWFGNYDKVSMVLEFLEKEFQLKGQQTLEQCAFVGDSPNDEPMFEVFPHSFGVKNIEDFASTIKKKPAYIAGLRGGLGFSQIAQQILKN
ncbi:MAG: HAD-IIB family hydrolase [Bdellovibrionota bacterium]